MESEQEQFNAILESRKADYLMIHGSEYSPDKALAICAMQEGKLDDLLEDVEDVEAFMDEIEALLIMQGRLPTRTEKYMRRIFKIDKKLNEPLGGGF